MITVNAIGDTCPIPVVKAKEAIKNSKEAEVVRVLVDNEIATQNLTKMAVHSGYESKVNVLDDGNYAVDIFTEASANIVDDETYEKCNCALTINRVAAIGSDTMGSGNDELGKVLIKGFIYALSKQEEKPSTILFYNGGAKLTVEESDSLEDIRQLEKDGTVIMTCGTCLNYYGLTDKLAVGTITNMYDIVNILTNADVVIRP